jgi:hypothetical protein
MVTSATNARTFVSTILPYAGYGHSVLLVLIENTNRAARSTAFLECVASSFCFDFVARQKLGGVNMVFFIQNQLPVIKPGLFAKVCPWSIDMQTLGDWLLPRVLELTYTAWDLEPFAQDCGWSGPPFRWDEERRFLLRCELDAAFFRLYLPATPEGHWKPARVADGGIRDESDGELAALKHHFLTPRDAVAYIMDTFPIVCRKDEEKWGDYRAKRVILEIYDEMTEAIRSLRPYETHLNPPPADPRCCHPPRSETDRIER